MLAVHTFGAFFMSLIILHISLCVLTIFKTNVPNEAIKCHGDAECDGNGPGT